MKSTVRNFIIFFFLFILGISIFLILMGRSGMNSVAARDYASSSQEKLFTSIEVKEGDTLWSIAGEYMSPEYNDKRDFIKEVQQMNHITGSVIRTGSHLLIPYYDATE